MIFARLIRNLQRPPAGRAGRRDPGAPGIASDDPLVGGRPPGALVFYRDGSWPVSVV